MNLNQKITYMKRDKLWCVVHPEPRIEKDSKHFATAVARIQLEASQAVLPLPSPAEKQAEAMLI